MMGTLLAACAASAPMPGTNSMCPGDAEWAAFGFLIIGVSMLGILYVIVLSIRDAVKKARSK